nr:MULTISPECIES: D-alanyl-D-alanine carboxypeptidase family protein [unclassified Pseudoflavonifractor]
MNHAEMLHTGPLVLVNREHPLPAEPSRADLLSVSHRHPGILLNSRAKLVLCQLLSDLGCTGDIVPVSGYRSKAEQLAIFENALRSHGREFTETFVAYPGCSEHQTGLAIDLGENRPDLDFLCPQFPDEGACRAFRARAADYGFILRYPAGKEEITGIGCEPWHFRYVGWPHAKLMEERGFTLEEYIQWLSGYSEEGVHLGYEVSGRAFEFYTVPADNLDGLHSRLPSDIPCQWSGNNAGGVVVTLWRKAG